VARQVRREWYAKDEALRGDDLREELYQGIRPASAYRVPGPQPEGESGWRSSAQQTPASSSPELRRAARGQRQRIYLAHPGCELILGWPDRTGPTVEGLRGAPGLASRRGGRRAGCARSSG